MPKRIDRYWFGFEVLHNDLNPLGLHELFDLPKWRVAKTEAASNGRIDRGHGVGAKRASNQDCERLAGNLKRLLARSLISGSDHAGVLLQIQGMGWPSILLEAGWSMNTTRRNAPRRFPCNPESGKSAMRMTRSSPSAARSENETVNWRSTSTRGYPACAQRAVCACIGNARPQRRGLCQRDDSRVNAAVVITGERRHVFYRGTHGHSRSSIRSMSAERAKTSREGCGRHARQGNHADCQARRHRREGNAAPGRRTSCNSPCPASDLPLPVSASRFRPRSASDARIDLQR